MAIKSIEIICRPCPKCEQLQIKIHEAIKGIELQYKIKIIYEFKHNPHLADLSKYALNPSQTPAVIINGNVEVAGRIEPGILKMKLHSIHCS